MTDNHNFTRKVRTRNTNGNSHTAATPADPNGNSHTTTNATPADQSDALSEAFGNLRIGGRKRRRRSKKSKKNKKRF